MLPIAGKVTIGLSSDELFNALDGLTRVEVVGPQPGCYTPPSCAVQSAVAVAPMAAPGGGGVTILAHEVVGPYETVQLRASDPKALGDWLALHHYAIPAESQAIIDEYAVRCPLRQRGQRRRHRRHEALVLVRHRGPGALERQRCPLPAGSARRGGRPSQERGRSLLRMIPRSRERRYSNCESKNASSSASSASRCAAVDPRPWPAS